jgi:gliding motility-associated-like protein
MNSKRYSLLFVLAILVLSIPPGLAQTFTLNGNTAAQANNCYQLTSAINSQNGNMWSTTLIDLTQPFDMRFLCNFGSVDANGADGMVFVLQSGAGNVLGIGGGGMGYQGITPSLGIQFDTWQNADVFDPTFDHIAITTNGIPGHSGATSIAAPVQASATNVNIEDGQDHQVRITWNPANNQIQVYFDCQLRLTSTYNIPANVFAGQSMVRWGWTASTGGANNVHRVCLVSESISASADTSICQGGNVPLSVSGNPANVYLWQPATGLSTTTGANVVASPAQTTAYIVSFSGFCGMQMADSITVTVLPVLSETIIDSACGTYLDPNGQLLDSSGVYTYQLTAANGCDSVLTLDLTIIPPDSTHISATACDSYVAPNGQTLFSSGNYLFTLTDQSGCDSVVTLNLVVYPPFTVSLGTDQEFCFGDSYLLTPNVQGGISTQYSYVWQNQSTAPTYTATNMGMYYVVVSDTCHSAGDTVLVNVLDCGEIKLPNVFTPNSDGTNDVWAPISTDIGNYEIYVYNRWGKLVHQFSGPSFNYEGWDGSDAADGTYFVVLKANTLAGKLLDVQGTITLLR